jgi:hypothetical protein
MGALLISSEVITLTTYLGNWALIAHVITSKFLLDSYMFLLKAMGASSLEPLPFQAHLRLARKLLTLGATTCVPPFK